jgi:hypothetical protein
VGYFRATKRCFAVPFHEADVAYVAHQLGYTPDQIDLAAYDAKATARRHRRLPREYKERSCRGRPDQRHALHTLVEDVNEGSSTPLAHLERIAFCEE